MDIKERIDSMLRQNMELTTKIERTEARMNAEVAALRHDIKEATWTYMEELEGLKAQRDGVREEILKLWRENFDLEVSIAVPFGKVSRRNYREIVVHDKVALFNALDRAGRLDLVDYVFKESEVAKLYAMGKLDGLNEKAVEVTDRYQLQVRPSKGEKNG